jgi:hypothetical protein
MDCTAIAASEFEEDCFPEAVKSEPTLLVHGDAPEEILGQSTQLLRRSLHRLAQALRAAFAGAAPESDPFVQPAHQARGLDGAGVRPCPH